MLDDLKLVDNALDSNIKLKSKMENREMLQIQNNTNPQQVSTNSRRCSRFGMGYEFSFANENPFQKSESSTKYFNNEENIFDRTEFKSNKRCQESISSPLAVMIPDESSPRKQEVNDSCNISSHSFSDE